MYDRRMRQIALASAVALASCSVVTSLDDLVGSDGGAGFCASLSPAPAFCDDFDHGTFGAQWETPLLSGGGILGSSNQLAYSPPTSLHALTGSSDAGCSQALPAALSGTASVIDYSFALYIAQSPMEGGVAELGGVGVDIGGDAYYVDIFLAPDKANMEHDNDAGPVSSMRAPLSQPIPRGVWVPLRWHLVLTADGGGPSALLEMGEQPSTQILFAQVLPPYGYAPGTPRFSAGIGYATPEKAGTEVYVDNVVVRVTP
jgi:hypothetical protein